MLHYTINDLTQLLVDSCFGQLDSLNPYNNGVYKQLNVTLSQVRVRINHRQNVGVKTNLLNK